MGAHLDDNEHEQHGEFHDRGTLEPELTRLEVESCRCDVAQKLWLAAELLAHARAQCGKRER